MTRKHYTMMAEKFATIEDISVRRQVALMFAGVAKCQ